MDLQKDHWIAVVYPPVLYAQLVLRALHDHDYAHGHVHGRGDGCESGNVSAMLMELEMIRQRLSRVSSHRLNAVGVSLLLLLGCRREGGA